MGFASPAFSYPLTCSIVVLFASPTLAELAPRYTTWQDFAAVVNQSKIPEVLGVVDSIERTGYGRFVVRGGACTIDVKVFRQGATDPAGRPIAGGSHVSRVEVGPKRCKP